MSEKKLLTADEARERSLNNAGGPYQLKYDHICQQIEAATNCGLFVIDPGSFTSESEFKNILQLLLAIGYMVEDKTDYNAKYLSYHMEISW